jgi:hypothetical protein
MMNKLEKETMHKHLDNNSNLFEINTSNISSMPNIVKTHNHHYNVVIHNLQQIKTPKTHSNCLQKKLLLSSPITTFLSFSIFDHSRTMCKKQGTQLDQTPFSFNFKLHLYFSPYNKLCTVCPKKEKGKLSSSLHPLRVEEAWC